MSKGEHFGGDNDQIEDEHYESSPDLKLAPASLAKIPQKNLVLSPPQLRLDTHGRLDED
jgi:hypothetical protein